MVFKKVLPRCMMPLTSVHYLLTAHGFKKSGSEDNPIYQAKVQDASTQTEYQINIPVRIDQDYKHVKLGKVYMNDVEPMPFHIKNAIHCKLKEIADYLYRVKVPL